MVRNGGCCYFVFAVVVLQRSVGLALATDNPPLLQLFVEYLTNYLLLWCYHFPMIGFLNIEIAWCKNNQQEQGASMWGGTRWWCNSKQEASFRWGVLVWHQNILLAACILEMLHHLSNPFVMWNVKTTVSEVVDFVDIWILVFEDGSFQDWCRRFTIKKVNNWAFVW
jgi:hypothetical protein